MDLLDKKNWPGTFTLPKQTKTMIDTAHVEEAKRRAFEASHPFKVGDKVFVINSNLILFKMTSPVGVVEYIKTNRSTGCSIGVKFDEIVTKFYDPNNELIIATNIVLLLYG